MSAKSDVDKLLIEHGAILIRRGKHEVWKLPNDNQFTRAATGSDRRNGHNELSELRHALGLVNCEARTGERRERKPKQKRGPVRTNLSPSINSSLADALRQQGVAEDRLRAEIEQLTTERDLLLASVETLKAELIALRAVECGCLVCRVKRRITGKSRRGMR